MISTDPWIWISAILTICSFTLLYGDNKLFRFAEYTYVAVVVGHSVVTGVLTLKDRFTPAAIGASPMLIISIVLGLMSLFVVWRKYAWIASIPLAVVVGVGAGLSIRALMATDIIGNMRATVSETALVLAGTPDSQLGNLIRIVFTVGTLFYFMFTVFLKGTMSTPVRYLREFGKYCLLIYLGLSLGNGVQQLSGLATSAINRLIRTWLGF